MGGAPSIEPAVQLADVALERQRRKLLSSAVAFMYFTLLMAYTLYPPPSVGTGNRRVNLFVGLQLLILGVWIAELVGGRDGFYILVLVVGFVGFVFCRDGDYERKLGEILGLGKELGQPTATSPEPESTRG